MSNVWRTARVFISSTFLDMQAERDHLVRIVFPRLRDALLQRRIHVVDVDLRWGVTAEQDALTACRSIIDECRPHFLCMLGGRFGYVPPGSSESITAQEIVYATMDQSEALSRSLFYFRDEAATAAMEERQAGEFREPPSSEAAERLASLKEAIRDRGYAPFVYSATWDRDSERLTNLDEFGERVYRDLLQSILQDDAEDVAETDEFAEANAAIETWIEERTSRWIPDGRSSARDALEGFVRSDGQVYCLRGLPGVGKTTLLAKFYQRVRADRPDDLVIPHFVGCSERSASPEKMLRRLCHELIVGARLDLHRDNRLKLLQRKTRPRLSLNRNSPERLREIRAEAKKEAERVVADYRLANGAEELRRQFLQLLSFAASRQNVLIVVDSIDRLAVSDGLDEVNWIPASLPRYAKLIVSASLAFDVERLRRRTDGPVEEILPPFSEEEASALIVNECRRYGKSLGRAQVDELLSKQEAGSPQYLVSALEELRTVGSYQTIASDVRSLPETRASLLGWILDRLENDSAFRDENGELAGKRLLPLFGSLLAVSRQGLTERELIGLIEPGSTRGNVAALLRFLRHYLVRNGELIDFSDAEVRDVVVARYASAPTERERAHSSLAAWFRSHADPANDGSWQGSDPRPFRELVFHLSRSRALDLPAILLHFEWLQARANHGQAFELIDDLREALSALPAVDAARKGIETLLAILEFSASTIADDPHQLASQLVGRIDVGESPLLATLVEQARAWKGALWMTTEAPQLTRTGAGLFRMVKAHGVPITATALSVDRKTLISAASDSIRVWDASTGRMLRSFSSDGKIVKTLLVASESKIVTASIDGSVQVWDVDQERLSCTLVPARPDGTFGAPPIALVSRATMLSACDASGSVRLWRLSGETELPPLRPPIAQVAHEMKARGVAAVGATPLSGLPEKRSAPAGGVGQRTATVDDDELYDSRSMITLLEPTDDDLLGPAPTDREGTELLGDVLGRRLVAKTGRLLWVWDFSQSEGIRERVYTVEEWKTRTAQAALSDDGQLLALHYVGREPITVDLDTEDRCPSPPSGMGHIRGFTAGGRRAISSFRRNVVEWDLATGEICRRDVEASLFDDRRRFGLETLPIPETIRLSDEIAVTTSDATLIWHDAYRSVPSTNSTIPPRLTAIRWFGDSSGATLLDSRGGLRTWWESTQRLASPFATVSGACDVGVASEGSLVLVSIDAPWEATINGRAGVLDKEYWSLMLDYDRVHPLALYDAKSGRLLLELGKRTPEPESSRIDGALIATLSARASMGVTADSHRVHLWSLQDGSCLSSIGPFKRVHYDDDLCLRPFWIDHDWGPHVVICSIAVSEDGDITIFGSSDGTVRVWDTGSAQELFKFAVGRSDVSVAMTPCGTWAAALGENRLELWNVPQRRKEAGHEIGATAANRRRTAALSISSTGDRVAYAYDRTVCLAQLRPRLETARFTSDDTVSACQISPDGDTVLAADEVGRMLVLRVQEADRA